MLPRALKLEIESYYSADENPLREIFLSNPPANMTVNVFWQ